MPELFFTEESFAEFNKFKQIVRHIGSDEPSHAVTISGGYIHYEQDYIKVRCKIDTVTSYGVYFLHEFTMKSVVVVNENPSLVK